ncbi:malate/lactate/ureidoglycolate dehydrogenase [Limobrevibacterium gyesilva]|uniref:Malate/lactate/ureidoglycolate dehydrogenase n=1 Tax=Limobrevibacterium gyesilva TaxID=2991712 RepID=A0AA41YKG6_9PROT|nr:malate/lactate/ureidoglycolate dehydrogenase [Limobrevibacterium gyesilva]MCW3474255.1 malate/lactate/ureidoglycolate dehydrogenase [Limobrevibacterium gyesilva]
MDTPTGRQAATHTIGADALRALVADIFRAAGCDQAEAERIGFHLVSANLTGHDSHGVIRTPRYVQYLREGKVVKGQTIKVVAESPTHAVVDGGYGFGQTVGPQAVDLGIAKAKAAGMCIVALRKSGHIGRIGDWGERAAEAGLVSIHFVNVENGELVAPFGGVSRRFSTNPFCVAIPSPDGQPPLLLDFATSLVAEGKVLVASNGGKKLPEGALIKADGELSTDPATLYGPLTQGGPRDPANGEGAIRAFGEHKGSGLAFMCDILAGVLTGGGTSGPVPGGKRGLISNGMFSIYLDPAHFGAQGFVAQARAFADYVKSSRPAATDGDVLVPGEPEARTRATRLQDGIPLQADTWANLVTTARNLGIAEPQG